MAMRKIEDSEIRKIFQHGDSRAVTLPVELLRELGWSDNQKVIAKKYGNGILIKDWKKNK
jgi:antitoxin component of MazEF toxin-antitoxin module